MTEKIQHEHRTIGNSVEITVERAAFAKEVTGLKIKVTGDNAEIAERKLIDALLVAIRAAESLPPSPVEVK